MGDGAARAARRRRRLVQGLRAGAGVRAAAHGRARSRAGPTGSREVLAHDDERGWLLLADAGTPIGVARQPAGGVARGAAAATPSCNAARPRTRTSTSRTASRPAARDAARSLRGAAARATCRSTTTRSSGSALRAALRGALRRARRARHPGDGPARRPAHGERLRDGTTGCGVLDWGDASIAHPFASLVVTFRFLEEINELAPGDPWFARYATRTSSRGARARRTFELAFRVGSFAHAFAWTRQRDHLPERRAPSSTHTSRTCCGARSGSRHDPAVPRRSASAGAARLRRLPPREPVDRTSGERCRLHGLGRARLRARRPGHAHLAALSGSCLRW